MDNSLFALFPSELRNRLYDIVFENPIIKQGEFKKVIALTQTCRQIRQESHTMFYHDKTLMIEAKGGSERVRHCDFLDSLGENIVIRFGPKS